MYFVICCMQLGYTLLHWAVRDGDEEMVMLLISFKANEFLKNIVS